MEHARGSDHCEAAVLELDELAAREGLHGPGQHFVRKLQALS